MSNRATPGDAPAHALPDNDQGDRWRVVLVGSFPSDAASRRRYKSQPVLRQCKASRLPLALPRGYSVSSVINAIADQLVAGEAQKPASRQS